MLDFTTIPIADYLSKKILILSKEIMNLLHGAYLMTAINAKKVLKMDIYILVLQTDNITVRNVVKKET